MRTDWQVHILRALSEDIAPDNYCSSIPGLLLIRVLKARGLTRIIATEPNPIRAQMAYESGATLVINPSEDNSSFAPDASFDISFDCGE